MAEKQNIPEIRFEGFTDPWEQRKLGEIFEEYSEKNRADLPPLTIIQGGGTVYRDESNRNLQFDKNSLSNYKAVNPDDFIVHLRSFEGGLEKATYCGLISPAYHTFHGDGIDSDFYYLYFRSKRFIDTDLKPHVYGIRDGRSIDIDGMKTIPIPWTTVNEQRAIGGFYNSLDSFITLHQRKYDKLCTVKKSMLDKMFPKPGETEPEIRFEGFTDPWEQRKFSDLSDRVSIQSSDSDLPQVEYEDIISGMGMLNKNLRDKEGGKTGIKFYAGDVLYGKLRPYLMNWLYPQFNGVAVGDFWVLRAIECDSSFLYRLVQTDSFQRLANVSSGSKMPRADWNLISQSSFAVPADHAEQKAIAKSLAELDDLITLHQRKLELLQNIKKSLLDKMFV